MQGSLSNFAGGVLILILKPFKVGDYISAGGLEGTVSKIDLFYTTLITLDNRLNIIPNGSLSNASLTNLTAFDTRRVDFLFGISYTSDISKAKQVIEECASEHELVIKDKKIFAYVANLDASQVTLRFHSIRLLYMKPERSRRTIDKEGLLTEEKLLNSRRFMIRKTGRTLKAGVLPVFLLSFPLQKQFMKIFMSQRQDTSH